MILNILVIAGLYMIVGALLYFVKLDEYFKLWHAVFCWPLIVFVSVVCYIVGFIDGIRGVNRKL